MTTSSTVLVPAQVSEMLQTLVKALRAFQMYLPNNPIYQRAIENARAAFQPIWAATDELVLTVAETDLLWEDEPVYQQPAKSESLAWTLYKDGLRVLTLHRGVEKEEIVTFLEKVNRARFLSADAGDDLLTLLWEQDFQWIQYQFTEPFADAALPEAGPGPSADPQQVRQQVAEEAPPRPQGVVTVDDFDSTLYFLDEREIEYITREVEVEYARDVRASALAILFDIFEAHRDGPARTDVCDILDQLFPNLLNAGEFRAVASILRETRALRDPAHGASEEHRRRLEAHEAQLSDPAIVGQLLQSLEVMSTLLGDADIGEVLRELRPGALETIVVWIPRTSSPSIRKLLEEAADRLAVAHAAEVLRLLRSPSSEARPGIVALCGRLKLQGAVPGLGEALGQDDPSIRLAAVQALAEIATPGALAHVDRAIEDADRNVRLAAVRAAGARGYRAALRRIEAVVLGKNLRELDLTEKMAFFEAYGNIAGASGIAALEGILAPRGLLKRRESPEIRACAAVALGKIRTPEAREILQRVADDRDLVVRNAVTRALRDGGREGGQ